ncbi:phosphate ABC transporter substrate-binding protein [Palaeococcus pacificus DY20341]|uniref:Phosphate ABC transporter substrate-binding protein n=1 Tax=Palaeococcus pacificus DY20341 TaxID=1343739 RepID=A0A075LZS4_9EURY|nr:DUF2139 domain-containing protein [Palaeococcus pacificus]AIF70078.1 phosphate ABC transporter substrate-binding protein [Palaeococcus pacificus DY20341]
MAIWEKLYRFPPRYGPEWGSGGIFGLKYYKDVLYYTVAFEGEAHFVRDEHEKIYEFDLVGEKPTSGGDTYNAVDVVDEFIYFGGWIHAPAIYNGKGHASTINFVNKYSHIHEYDIENDEIRLVWKDSIHHPTDWAGEVSDILYDPYNDRLLIAREDGHKNLGIYAVDRKSGKSELLNPKRSLKGAIIHDNACFGVGHNFTNGLEGIHCLDLITGKWETFPVGDSVDGAPFIRPLLGDMASAYNRVFAFVRGGLFVGNPLNGEAMSFFRLFEFYTFYAPMRTNALPIGGGLLIAYNSMHDAIYQPRKEDEKEFARFTNTIVGPSVLVYIAPPMVKIVGAFGARITSIEKAGGKILLGTNTTPNTGALEATPFDTGSKDILVLDEKILQENPPALSFSLPLIFPSIAMTQYSVGNFGGIPLEGYKEPRLIIYADKDNELSVYEYDLLLPPTQAYEERFDIKKGRNVIDLSSFSGIVSFSLKEPDFEGKVRIELR